MKREMKQTFLMEEYELSYYSWPHFEPFIRNDLFSKEKKKIPITQWRKCSWETGIWKDRQPGFFQIIIRDVSRC